MRRTSLKSLMIGAMVGVTVIATVPALSDVRSDLKKSAAALQKASFVLTSYRQGQVEPTQLAKAEDTIEKTWQEFAKTLGTKHPFAKDLAFIRARSVTAAKSRKKIVPAWKDALKQIPRQASKANRINLYMEAGYAAAVAKNYQVAEQYFGYARSLAVAEGGDKDRVQLYLRLNELKTTGEGMEWRPLRDALSDFRKASEAAFNLWTVPRLDALIGEAEIRVSHQPQDDDKRTDLAELKARILLAEKNINDDIPPSQLKRLRSLMYILEDYWQL
ncbi:MAG: hypothetical protein AB3N28_12840 [Kordiimonas sp.]